ncbi:MAG: hypothetical protein K0U38_00640 [Epsilonproteobacteria bacterium]|nr:hypothetical protein [Campylobacterota bacterium]
MKNYRLKLTALSSIHIGTGEVYEPTNYVIDDGFLYEFDEVLFLKHLPSSKRAEFVKYVEMQTEHGYELFEKIHHFIVTNKKYAKEVAFNKVKISKTIENKYGKDIARKVQVEKKRNQRFARSIFNKFEIQKTQRLQNRGLTYLSGSSIKGAISTAYQEYIYKEKGKEKHSQYFSMRGDKLFRNLSVSDTLAQKSNALIGYAVNRERFEEDSSEISTMLEVNTKESEYLLNLTIKSLLNDDGETIDEEITKDKIINACNSHYMSIYEDKEHTKLSLRPNQFIMSLGRHSGARAVTIDGIRKILVKLAQIQNKKDEGDNATIRVERLHKKSYFESDKIAELFAEEKFLDDKERRVWRDGKHFIEEPSKLENLIENRNRVTINAYLTEETTVWRFSKHDKGKDEGSFGWVVCEFIEEEEYTKLFSEFKLFEKEKIEERDAQQKEARLKIKKSKEDVQLYEQRKREAQEQEEKLAQEAKKKREREVASMTPLEKEIDELVQNDENTPKSTLLFTALKNNQFENERLEALEVLKSLLIEEKKWKEVSTAKKPEKDKVYKRTLEIMKMIEESKT